MKEEDIDVKDFDACKNNTEIFALLANKIAQSIGTLLEEKNKAYGNSVTTATQIMSSFYPDGIPLSKMDDALVVVRICDKLSRIAKGNKAAFGESPWKDIAGYAILQMTKDEMDTVLQTIALRKKFLSSSTPKTDTLDVADQYIEKCDYGLPTMQMRDGEIDHALSEEEIGAEMKRVFDAQKKLEEK